LSLKGKVALIAGGGQGIGRAASFLLAQKSAQIVIVDINPDAGREVLIQIQENNGDAVYVQADVSRWDDVQAAVHFSLEKFGRIDVLFSSVGIYARSKLVDTEEELWDRMMRINVKSAYLLCKAVIPSMQAAGGGSIILSSSSVGWHDAAPNITAYATSKFAITGLTKAAACDYIKDGIRVNCICPGPTDTPMIHRGRSPEELAAFVSELPIQRLADPQEVARVVVFLASDESAYITGVAFPVDGGQTAWV
jgi:NAD(P)-dependent dehydrogenase (short-subunit alcohol dehydrogenase family)